MEPNQEYQMGELRGDVNSIKHQLEKIEQKIDTTHDTHSEGYGNLDRRVASLERFRSRVLGGAAVAGALATTAVAVAKISAAGLLP